MPCCADKEPNSAQTGSNWLILVSNRVIWGVLADSRAKALESAKTPQMTLLTPE